MSDSDAEFEKYLQDSLSSSTTSSLSLLVASENKFRKSRDEGLDTGGVSTLGMSWLKSSRTTNPIVPGTGGVHVSSTRSPRHSLEVTIPSLGNDDDEWITQTKSDDDSEEEEEEERGGRKKRGGDRWSRSGRKLSHRSSVSDDPLNFSTSSGYSLLSELEHQLGMRGSGSSKHHTPSHQPPGEDTIAEEEDKKRFFEELEGGLTSSLNYSELNRQLSSTSMSGRGLSTTNPLKTINENDATPHASSDKEHSEDNHTHLPSVETPTHGKELLQQQSQVVGSPNTSLQSSSSRSLSLPSPLHSSSGHSLHKTPTKALGNSDKLAPISENGLKILSSSSNNGISVFTGTKVSEADPSKSRKGSNEELLRPLLQSTSSTSIQATNWSSKVAPPPSIPSSKSDLKGPVPKSNSNLFGLDSSNKLSPTPVTEAKTQNAHVPDLKSSLPGDNGEKMEGRNLEKLLRSLAAEELTSMTHEMMKKQEMTTKREDKSEESLSEEEEEDTDHEISKEEEGDSTEVEVEESDKVDEDSPKEPATSKPVTGGVLAMNPPTNRTSNKALPPPHLSHRPSFPGNHRNLLTQSDSLELMKTELRGERERIRELEEKVKEKERQEERVRLECSQQIRELRTQLLEAKSKLRKLEDSNRQQKLAMPVPGEPDKEQERLIQGYQKENERLYAELTQVKKEFKTAKSDLTDENSRLGSELANLRIKTAAQEETLHQLREQQARYKSLGQLNGRGQDQDQTPVESLEEKYRSLEEHVGALTSANTKLKSDLERRDQEVLVLKMEAEEMRKRHTEQVSLLKNEIQQLCESHQVKLREKDEELEALRDIIKVQEDTPTSESYPNTSKMRQQNRTRTGRSLNVLNGTSSRPQLVRSRSTADAKRIKELERQVQELYTALKKRHPNSIPVLMYASSAGLTAGGGGECEGDEGQGRKEKEMVRHLEERVKELESRLMEQEGEGLKRMEELQQQFHQMEGLYEEQIASLTAQLSDGSGRKERVVPGRARASPHEEGMDPVTDNTRNENNQLREKVSQLSLELAHQKLQLKGYIAEIESERRKTQEHWEEKMRRIEEENKQKLDQLMVSLVREREDSDIARLKSRLSAREAKIRTLEEELDLVKTDGEILSVLKAREQELERQVEALKEELAEAKKHHTPEMHHFSSLLAKIAQLESRQTEYQRKLKEATSGQLTQEDVNKLERQYKKKLMEKNLQIEKFREELDALMDTLYTLQQGNMIVKQ